MNSEGFSLIELMVTVIICSFVIGFISINFSQLNRLASRFNEYIIFKEQFLIFLLQFEEDFQQAEVVSEQDIENLSEMSFQIDRNNDEDFNDSGERTQYRWDSSLQKIDRKSGSGYFQAFLDGVSDFTWTQIGTDPLCFQMNLTDVFSTSQKRIRYCRPVF